MAYKYQNEIEDAVDVIYEVMGEDKHGKAQRELVEVYRKAEAFDDYMKHNLSYGKTYYEITREHIADEMKITLEKYESEEDSQ